jgi:hypothetical protein
MINQCCLITCLVKFLLDNYRSTVSFRRYEMGMAGLESQEYGRGDPLR